MGRLRAEGRLLAAAVLMSALGSSCPAADDACARARTTAPLPGQGHGEKRARARRLGAAGAGAVEAAELDGQEGCTGLVGTALDGEFSVSIDCPSGPGCDEDALLRMLTSPGCLDRDALPQARVRSNACRFPGCVLSGACVRARGFRAVCYPVRVRARVGGVCVWSLSAPPCSRARSCLCTRVPWVPSRMHSYLGAANSSVIWAARRPSACALQASQGSRRDTGDHLHPCLVVRGCDFRARRAHAPACAWVCTRLNCAGVHEAKLRRWALHGCRFQRPHARTPTAAVSSPPSAFLAPAPAGVLHTRSQDRCATNHFARVRSCMPARTLEFPLASALAHASFFFSCDVDARPFPSLHPPKTLNPKP
jgi:hypothetical protein